MYYNIRNKIIETQTPDFDFEKLGGVGDVLFHYMKKHGSKAAQVSQVLFLFHRIKNRNYSENYKMKFPNILWI